MGQHNPIGGELRIEPCKIDPLKYVCRIRRLQQHRVGSVRRPSRHIHGAKIGGVDLGARDLGSTVDSARGRCRRAPPLGAGGACVCVEGRRLRPNHKWPHHDSNSGHQRSLEKASPINCAAECDSHELRPRPEAA